MLLSVSLLLQSVSTDQTPLSLLLFCCSCNQRLIELLSSIAGDAPSVAADQSTAVVADSAFVATLHRIMTIDNPIVDAADQQFFAVSQQESKE